MGGAAAPEPTDRTPGSLVGRSPRWGTTAALLSLVFALNVVLLPLLGVTNRWVVGVCTLGSAAAAAVLAMPDQGRMLTGRSARFYAMLMSAIVLPGLIGYVWDATRPDPTVQRVLEAVEGCGGDDSTCEILEHITLGTGVEEVTAFGVNRFDEDFHYNTGSAVVVLNEDQTLRWKSELLAGFGLQAMDTDSTTHLFLDFAVTNHSGVVWVLAVRPDEVQSFGTIGGGLLVDGYGHAGIAGARDLYAHREGWPANTHNPTTSRDVFTWTGNTYAHHRCEIIEPGGPPAESRVVRTIAAGAPGCLQPVHKSPVELDGERPADEPPP